jgi:hypothetical protein
MACKAFFFFYFLDGYSGYHQIPIHPNDQSKTTFTCPYGTYVYRRMSFRIVQRSSFIPKVHDVYFFDMIEEIMKVFMDNFLFMGKLSLIT